MSNGPDLVQSLRVLPHLQALCLALVAHHTQSPGGLAQVQALLGATSSTAHKTDTHGKRDTHTQTQFRQRPNSYSFV